LSTKLASSIIVSMRSGAVAATVTATTAAALAVLAAACGSPPAEQHRPFPQVGTTDGAVLAPMRLVTIVAQNDSADADAFFAFSNAIGASRWWRRIAPEWRLGTLSVRANLMGPTITADVTDHDVFTYINDIVAGDASLARDGHTLYVLYLPAGIQVVQDGTPNTGCHLFGAYHISYGTRGDNLAVVQRCFDTFPVENMTVAASHEIIEAATDPDDLGYKLPAIAERNQWQESVWNAFELTGDAEIADLCEGTFWSEGSSVYQRVWSNAAAARGGDPCIPEIPDPYYSTAFAQDWYVIDAGATTAISFTAWATGPMTAWPVTVDANGTAPGFMASVTGAPVNAGESGQILVSAPAGAVSGDFAVLDVVSERPDPSAGTPALIDGAHINLVGVYVR
jgi:hypothetical protein